MPLSVKMNTNMKKKEIFESSKEVLNQTFKDQFSTLYQPFNKFAAIFWTVELKTRGSLLEKERKILFFSCLGWMSLVYCKIFHEAFLLDATLDTINQNSSRLGRSPHEGNKGLC